jgi:hypothetical protein
MLIKKQTKATTIIAPEIIENKILFIRGKKVMLDRDLATLYDVETKVLNQDVKRNIKRFPIDFMFTLTSQEIKNLKSQIVTSSWGGRRTSPYAFSEHGILMLSSVLNSERAILVNIQIMRTFTKLKEMLASHKDLRDKIEAMEQKYDHQFKVVFDAIKRLIDPPQKPKPPIGFQPKTERKSRY